MTKIFPNSLEDLQKVKMIGVFVLEIRLVEADFQRVDMGEGQEISQSDGQRIVKVGPWLISGSYFYRVRRVV